MIILFDSVLLHNNPGYTLTVLKRCKHNDYLPRSNVASAVDSVIIHGFETAVVESRQGRFVDHIVTIPLSFNTDSLSNTEKLDRWVSLGSDLVVIVVKMSRWYS